MSVAKQIRICTKSLLICTENICLYRAPWHSTNSFLNSYLSYQNFDDLSWFEPVGFSRKVEKGEKNGDGGATFSKVKR